jgi:intein-encoded DNA endonuclease-like protein
MKKTFATLMATGLAFGSLTSFAFAAEQQDSSSKKLSTNISSTAKLGSLEDHVNGLSQLTKEEKSKLIAAYKNNTLSSVQDLLKKAGIVATQAAVKEDGSVKDKTEQNNDAAAVQTIDFKEYINGVDTLTKSEKSKLITAYENDDLESVKDLWEKAGIAAAQPAVQADGDEKSESQPNKDTVTAKPIDFKDYINGVDTLTKSEKSELIAAYDNDDFESAKDLWEKAGITAAQPATKASSEKGDGEQTEEGTVVEPIDFKDYVNELKELTQAEKKALIAAYDNNDFKSVEDLLKKAGIATAQPVEQAESVQEKTGTEVGNGQGKIGKTLQATDFAEFVNGLKPLTQAEKSKLIAAYKNNEMGSVQDLLKKAGISSTQGTAAVKAEKAKN